MIVDAFAVAGGYPARPVKIGHADLGAAMAKNGVDRALTMSMRAIQVDAVAGNDHVMSLASADARILPVAVVDPRAVTRLDLTIERAVAGNAAAFAFHMTAIPCPVGSLLFSRGLERANSTGKPLIFVCNERGQLTQIAEKTASLGCPRVLLAGVSYHHLGELLVLLEEFDHLYVETSWQVSPGAVELLAAAGPTRLLYGSMAPLRPMRPALNMAVDADIAPREKADILGRNALRFLDLEIDAEEPPPPLPEVAGLPSLPAIDLHCHIGTMPEQPSTCIGADGMQREYERFNIEYGVVSATSAYKDDLDAGNVEMLAAVESHSRLRGSVVANPHHWDDSLRWLDLAVEHPDILHVTVNPSSTYEPFHSPLWLKLFAEIARRRLPVFYNTPSQDTFRRSPEATTKGHILKVRAAPADELAMFRQLDREMPELPIVIGHGFGLDGLELAAGSRNIHLELCTTYPEQNVYRSALDAVGAERVVFGTDLDLISPAFVLGSLWEAELSAAEERLVLRDNALRLLGQS